MDRSKLFDKPVFKLEIALCLLWARLLISWLPFRRWRRALGPIADQPGANAPPVLTPPQLQKAVGTGRIIRKVAGRMPFRSDCLPQAMTGRWMLARRGIETRVAIGSRRGTLEEGLLFHAWLLAGDRVVTGGDESADFAPFGLAQDSDAGV